MIILAHRGYRHGSDPTRENKLQAIGESLDLGWGVETDIRRSQGGGFYISHDVAPLSPENDATPFLEAIRTRARAPVALNVKELGYEAELIELLKRNQVLDRVFLFDMELIEGIAGSTARAFHRCDSSVNLAARISDRSESVEQALAISESNTIWADEFDRLWLTKKIIDRLKAARKKVFAISPEIHGFSNQAVQGRWRSFGTWAVDGICTDYPEQAARFFR